MFNILDITKVKMVRFTEEYSEYKNILNAMVNDLDTLHNRIHRPYSLEEILANEFFLFIYETYVIGYTLLRQDKDPNTYMIRNFLIRKEYRGQGYGSLCFNIILSYLKYHVKAKKAVLMVSSTNKPAKDLYVGYGFKPIDTEIHEKLFLRF